MELVLDGRQRGGRGKSRLRTRFDKVRSRLETERRRTDRFRQNLDELVDIYHRRSIENDRVVLGDLVALADKLIVFASRKSLSEWHRIELDVAKLPVGTKIVISTFTGPKTRSSEATEFLASDLPCHLWETKFAIVGQMQPPPKPDQTQERVKQDEPEQVQPQQMDG